MLFNRSNYSCLLIFLNVDVVICIVDSDVLIPDNERENVITTEPAFRSIMVPEPLPLLLPFLVNFMTEMARDSQVVVKSACHVNLLLV